MTIISGFFDIAASACRKIENLLKGSLFLGILLFSFKKIENLWIESFFRSLYPKRRDFFFKKSHILKRGIFSPLIIVVAFLLFMILGNCSISFQTRIVIIVGLVSFTVFALISTKINRLKNPITFDMNDIGAIGITMFLVGVMFVFLSVIQVGGIPLLKPSLRYLLSPKLSIPSFLMIPAMALLTSVFADDVDKNKLSRERARFRTVILTIFCVFLLGLLGYRTPAIASILVVVVTGYYTKLFDVLEVLSGIVFAVLLIIGVGYFRASGEYLWNFSPTTLLSVRANFTMHIFDMLVNLSGFTGATHGKLTLSMLPGSELGPRFLIAKIIGWRPGITITSTLLGPMVVEFGTIGVLFGMGVLGFILGVGHEFIKSGQTVYAGIYAFLISYTLIGVETGIVDWIVCGFFVVATILYVLNFLKRFEKKKE